MAKIRQRVIKTHGIRQLLSERCRKEILYRRIRSTGRSLGIRESSIPSIHETSSLFSDHQALERL